MSPVSTHLNEINQAFTCDGPRALGMAGRVTKPLPLSFLVDTVGVVGKGAAREHVADPGSSMSQSETLHTLLRVPLRSFREGDPASDRVISTQVRVHRTRRPRLGTDR
jgi:hypothetical protein